jgi:hypothetical protein
LSGSAAIYIFDGTFGAYRWITSAKVFNKYGFSWGKVVTQSDVQPPGADWNN